MYGKNSFNKMPLAPMSCVMSVYNKPAAGRTWGDHAIDWYCMEISREHYMCYKILVKNTRCIQVPDTVLFKHQYITVLTGSKADAIVAMAKNEHRSSKMKHQQILEKQNMNNSLNWQQSSTSLQYSS